MALSTMKATFHPDETLKANLNGIVISTTGGLPAGGKTGQYLVKRSDADTSDADAAAAEILLNKTAYVSGNKLTGTMPNNGAVTGAITAKAQEYTVPHGYHDGSGKVAIASEEQAKIIAGNIKSGVTILGVTGSYGGESVTAQSKTATPSTSQQIILPDSGYDYLSQVTIAAIPYTETDNAAGGKTVTIAAA